MFNLEEMASGKIVLPNSVPLGFRFHPTEEEIVSHFLKNKMLGRDDLVQPITEVDFYKFEPWELANFSGVESDDPEWFFFCAPHFKYGNGGRTNRATRDGYWKVTGNSRNIKARRTKKLIGTKRTLVFHMGRSPNGVGTKWVMHEYHSVDNDHHGTTYVVCRLMKKDDEKCENDDVDSDLPSRSIQSVVPEVCPEENRGLVITLPLPETSSELLYPSAHLNPEKEIDLDEMINSLFVDGEFGGEEYWYEETVDPFNNHLIQSPWTGSTHLNPENEFDEDEFLNSLLVNGDESFDEETVDNLLVQSPWTGSTHLEGTMLRRDTDRAPTTPRGRAQPYRVLGLEPQSQVWSTGCVTVNPIKAEEAPSSASNHQELPEYFEDFIQGIALFLRSFWKWCCVGNGGCQCKCRRKEFKRQHKQEDVTDKYLCMSLIVVAFLGCIFFPFW